MVFFKKRVDEEVEKITNKKPRVGEFVIILPEVSKWDIRYHISMGHPTGVKTDKFEKYSYIAIGIDDAVTEKLHSPDWLKYVSDFEWKEGSDWYKFWQGDKVIISINTHISVPSKLRSNDFSKQNIYGSIGHGFRSISGTHSMFLHLSDEDIHKMLLVMNTKPNETRSIGLGVSHMAKLETDEPNSDDEVGYSIADIIF